MQEYKKILFFFLTAVIFLLNSCQSCTVPPRHGTAINGIHANLVQGVQSNLYACRPPYRVPRNISQALLPAVGPQKMPFEQINSYRRFDVAADKMPAKTFFMGLVEGTPYNMVVNPNVTGDISLTLKNVTIDQTMQAVRDVYGYEYKRTSYGYEVLAQELQTQIFNVNYLDVQRNGKSLTQFSSGQISEKINSYNAGAGNGGNLGNIANPLNSNSNTQPVSNTTVLTRSEINFWKDLESTLRIMVGTDNGRSVVVNPQAGVVIVHSFPHDLHQVARYLDRIQCSLNRQVILEAKILEVQLDDQYQAGINWRLFGQGIDQDSGGMTQNSFHTFDHTDMKDFEGIFALNVKGDFGTLIKLLQTQGNVQILSNPRISTLNNQKAVIKVGQDEFFVTGVSTANTYVGNSNQTVPTEDIGLTPFFSGVTLDVTPQISSDGTVILHIHPSISNVKNQTKRIELGTTANNTPNVLTLPLALSTIRESDNIVRAQSGQVVVIGGLMQNTTIEEVAGTPGASKVPFIGTLFRRTQQLSTKNELVILLRPVIVNRKTLADDMQNSDFTYEEMDRGFHVGGLPEVFGTQGERQVAMERSRSYCCPSRPQ